MVTNTLHGSLPWNATALGGDAAQTVTELEGTILIYGSFALVRTLLEHKLVDELHIGLYPVFLGAGERVRRRGAGRATALPRLRRTRRVSSRSAIRRVWQGR